MICSIRMLGEDYVHGGWENMEAMLKNTQRICRIDMQ